MVRARHAIKIYKPIGPLWEPMRSSLVVGGGMIILTGIVLYVALDGEAWLALIAGGGVLLVVGLVVLVINLLSGRRTAI